MKISINQYMRRSRWLIIMLFFVLLLSGGCLWRKQEVPSVPPRVISCVSGGKDIKQVKIEASYLTHINYAYVRIRKDGTPYLSKPGDEENLYYLTSLKTKNPRLKILLRVGGWDGSKYFSDVVRSDSSRRRLVSQLVVMVTMYNVDGVDIDWEYPGQIGAGNDYLPEDKWNYSLLLEDLRVALNRMAFMRSDNQHYLLTIDAGANQNWLDHVIMKDILRVVDFINVMTYDYFGEWDHRTGHVSNLYVSACEPYGNSVNQTVKMFERAGVPPGKIVIAGVSYGRWWSRVEEINNGLCQVARGKGGHWSYHVIVDSVMKIQDYHAFWDKKAKAPYLWNEKKAIFVSYENPKSLKAKARYVRKKKLGGIMFCDYSGDHNRELLKAIHKGLSK